MKSSTLTTACYGAGVALFLESLRYYRNDEWVGAAPYESAYVAIGFAVYLGWFCAAGYFVKKPVLQLAIGGAALLLAFALLTPVRLVFLAAWAAIFAMAVVGFAIISMWDKDDTGKRAAFIGIYLAFIGIAIEYFHRSTIFHDQRDYVVLGFTAALCVPPVIYGLRMARLPWVAAFVILTLFCAYALRMSEASDRRKAVPDATADAPAAILFVCDTMRADFTSLIGPDAAQTPTLHELKGHGIFFQQHYALAPWTVPSMHGLMSSNYPPGMDPYLPNFPLAEAVVKFRVPPDVPTLAELLNERDYYSGAFVGNTLLDNGDGLLRGFDLTQSVYRDWEFHHRKAGVMTRTPFIHDVIRRVVPSAAPLVFTDHTPMMTYLAKRFCQIYEGKRYFLYVHYMDPHGPYTPPKKFQKTIDKWPYPDSYTEIDHPPVSPEQLETIAAYLGEIEYVDDAMGQVIEAAGGWGILKHTVITMTSDHGEEFWDHGGTGHGHTLFQELLHVPWVIAGPSTEDAFTFGAETSAVDVMPTLAAMLGVEKPEAWRGVDIATSREGRTNRSKAFAQSNYLGAPLQMFVRDQKKLIRKSGEDVKAFYELADDPYELNPLDDHERMQEFDEALDEWSASFPSVITEVEGDVSDEEAAEREEQLRSLGYID